MADLGCGGWFEWDGVDAFGKVAVDGPRRAHPFGTDTGGEVGEGAGELVGVDLRGAEEGELTAAWPIGVGDGDKGHDRRPWRIRLEFEADQRQQGIDVAGGGGQANLPVFGTLRFEPQFELEQGAGQVLALESLPRPSPAIGEGRRSGDRR